MWHIAALVLAIVYVVGANLFSVFFPDEWEPGDEDKEK